MKKYFLTLFLLIIALNVHIADAKPEKDIVKFGNDIIIEKNTVVNKAIAISGNLIVEGTVQENAVVINGNLKLGPNAIIGKNAIAIMGKIEKSKGTLVKGNIISANKFKNCQNLGSCFGNIFGFLFTFFLIVNISFIILALIIVTLFPRPTIAVSSTIENKIGNVILWGIIGLLLVIPVAVFFILSVAGIILVPIEALFILGSSIYGYIVICKIVGNRLIAALKKSEKSLFWEVLWGSLTMMLVCLVPILGLFVKIMAMVIGFGGVLVTIYYMIKNKKASSSVA